MSFTARLYSGSFITSQFFNMSCGGDVNMADTYVATFSSFRLGLIDYPSPANEPEDI